MLVFVSFLATQDDEPNPVGINAAPPHFPVPVDRLPVERWDAFTKRLEGMLWHSPGGAVVLAFVRNSG